MEELSTAPIPGSTRVEDQRRTPANAARRHQENRRPVQSVELETSQEDDESASNEPEHDLDISV
jgi:hypothetical protein